MISHPVGGWRPIDLYNERYLIMYGSVLDAITTDDNLIEMGPIDLSQDITSDPTEILVNMAKKNEIDPWNIDIVEVTDKFLNRIEELERLDLRISGRTLFYASVLLRMKSNTLLEPEPDTENEYDEPLDYTEYTDTPIPPPPLRRRTLRPATLKDLITELKKAEKVEKRRIHRIKQQTPSERTKQTLQARNKSVMELAHEEDIEKRIIELNKKLYEVFKTKDRIKFTEITPEDNNDRMMTFLALLFIAGRKKIRLEQDKLFEEITICKQDQKGVTS